MVYDVRAWCNRCIGVPAEREAAGMNISMSLVWSLEMNLTIGALMLPPMSLTSATSACPTLGILGRFAPNTDGADCMCSRIRSIPGRL
jgi:hypothetical protein